MPHLPPVSPAAGPKGRAASMDSDQQPPENVAHMAPPSIPNAAWESALDWLLRLKEHPNNSALIADWNAWLAADPAHAAAWRKATRVWHLTGAVGQTSTRASVRSTRQPAIRRSRRRTRVAAFGGAIAACLVLTISLLFPDLQADYRSPLGETRTFTLSDGSQVMLDSGGAFNRQFDAAQRHIELLRGQAFFSVSHNKQRPFTIQAGSSRITVTGTAFEVKRSATQITVSVEQGSVRVRDARLNNPLLLTDLTAGERLSIHLDSAQVLRERQNPQHMAVWRRGLLLAHDTPLGELLDALRSRYPGLIVLRDERLLKQRVTGVFNLNDPHEALRALVTPHGGQVEPYTPWLLMVTTPALTSAQAPTSRP